jgi:hypothetical protein
MAVSEAAGCGHDPVAVWTAREHARDPKSVRPLKLRLVAVWAWFCWQAGTIGHRVTAVRWQPQMGFAAAREAAEAWRATLSLHLELDPAPAIDVWLQPSTFAGYDFVPLDNGADIAAEATAMRNCVRNYAARLVHNRCRLWSIRRDGARVATLSVGLRAGPLLTILELNAADNRPAPVEVWWAATRWLHQHDLSLIDPQPRAWGAVALDPCAWRTLWRPYWLAKRRIPAWLPLAPSRDALWDL